VKSLIIVEPEDSCAVPNNALHPLPGMKKAQYKRVARIEIQEAQKAIKQ
jgi:hypothetical protein